MKIYQTRAWSSKRLRSRRVSLALPSENVNTSMDSLGEPQRAPHKFQKRISRKKVKRRKTVLLCQDSEKKAYLWYRGVSYHVNLPLLKRRAPYFQHSEDYKEKMSQTRKDGKVIYKFDGVLDVSGESFSIFLEWLHCPRTDWITK